MRARRHLFAGILVSLIAGMLTPVFVAAPTGAATTTPPPVITAPSDGAVVPSGSTGPVTIDFSDAARLDFQVSVHCDGGYRWTTTYRPGGANPEVMSWSIPALAGPDSCRVTAYAGGNYGWDSNIFEVGAPAEVPSVTGMKVNLETFYPLVLDGYRDHMTLTFSTNVASTVTIEAIAADGAVARRDVLGRTSAGEHAWRWDGQTTAGSVAPTGSYRLRVTATDQYGRTGVAAASTAVSTEVRSTRAERQRKGNRWARRDKSKGCRVRNKPAAGAVVLACRGGRKAWVKYRFKVPKNATRIRWKVVGKRRCCKAGKVTKTGTRPRKRLYVVKVKVTKRSSFRVKRVRVRYSTGYRV